MKWWSWELNMLVKWKRASSASFTTLCHWRATFPSTLVLTWARPKMCPCFLVCPELARLLWVQILAEIWLEVRRELCWLCATILGEGGIFVSKACFGFCTSHWWLLLCVCVCVCVHRWWARVVRERSLQHRRWLLCQSKHLLLLLISCACQSELIDSINSPSTFFFCFGNWWADDR